MAEPSLTEHTRLLENEDEDDGHDYRLSRTQRTASWFAKNAVIISVSLLMAAVIVMLCVFFGGYNSHKDKPSPNTTVCSSAACVHAASEILYNLSPDYKNVDACIDFEQLTCAGWSERHDLRPDQGSAFTGTFMEEKSQTLLRHILEAPYPEKSQHSGFSPAQLVQTLSSADQDNFNKLKAAYNACMDEETIKKTGVKPLAEIMQQIIDIYPVNKSDSGKDALTETVLFLAKLGVSSLVSISTSADDKDPDVVVVQAAPPDKIGLPAKESYADIDLTHKYEITLTHIFQNFHHTEENLAAIAKQVVKFEKLLAEASPSAEDRNDVVKFYNSMTMREVESLTPQIRISQIIRNLAPADVPIDRLIVISPHYMKALSSVLDNTTREVIQMYFIWKFIQTYESVIEAEEIKPYSRFKNELQGKDPKSKPERWRICVNHIDNAEDQPNSGLGWILSRFFVEKAFSTKAKEFGDQIVTDIKNVFIEKLKTIDWMDEETTKLAIDKVHKIVQKIGYPTSSPNIMNPEELREFYMPITISESTFFRNALSMSRFGVAKEWSALGSPVDRNQWQMTVPTVNAYYDPTRSELAFPAGIMQFPVFESNLPSYLSFGAFGSIAGHELSHAFDSAGRHYDQNGNYTDWWSENTVAEFEKRAHCFVEQYNNFTISGNNGKRLHINGKLTLGENIADAGGVSAAFAAWKKRQAEAPNEDLPGLGFFTQEQLFFISYGSWWCGKERKQSAINSVYTDPHAPKWARILGTMANSQAFKKSFNCPTKKPVCELW